MNKRRINTLEAVAWRRLQQHLDTMSYQDIVAIMDARCGVAARCWALAYMDTCTPEELEQLGGVPDSRNPAQQRFHAAYRQWLETQP